MMKKWIAMLCSLLCVCVGCFFVACEQPNKEDEDTYQVRLNTETVRIYPYQTAELAATVYDSWGQAVPSAEVEWSVADTSVVAFEDGVIMGRKVGETNIVAEYDGVQSVCRVVVRETDNVPAVKTDKTELALCSNGDAVSLQAWVLYLDETYTQDVTFSYEVENEAVAVVEGSGASVEVRGVAKGETTLFVTAAWRGAQTPMLTTAIEITVPDLLYLTFTDPSEKTVYTSNVDGHSMESKVEPYVKKNDVLEVNPALTYVVTDENGEPSDLVTVADDGTVRANTQGKTGNAYVHYVFEEIYSPSVCVRVEYPVVDRTADCSVDVELDANQSISLQSITKELDLTGVVGVDGYVCEQGKVKDVKAGEFVWKLVHSEHYATAVNVTVCTKIIYSANDLNKMLSVYATKTKVGTLSYNATSNDVYSYDGYFILGDNIDFATNGERGVYNSGVLAQSFANSGAKETVALMGFNGTFDGRGFAIKNVTFASEGGASFTTGGGLFGAIGAKGVVKNLALVNIALSIESDNAPLATVASGKIDNVYIDLQEVEANASARLAGVACATYGAELSNIYVRKANTATGTRQHSGYVSVYDAAREGKQTTAKNIYIYNDASIQPWIAEMENGTLNPYGGNGTNAFKDVVVYSSIDMAGVYPTFKNFTIEWLSAYNKSQIAFEDDTYWDFTGAEPVFKTKEAQSTPITLSYVPVMEVKGTATVDLSEVTLFTEVTGAKIADVDVFASYANGVLTLDNAKTPNAAKSLGKNVDVTVLTNSGRYVFKADVYTKIITTAEELDKMLSEYAAKTSVGTLGRAIGMEVFSYDGYFLLGNTIDYAKDGARGVYDSGVTYLRTNYYDSNANNPAVMNVAGFKGVFDGQGYAIKNVEFKSTMSANDVCFYTGGGLFGAIATDGVVKNLALKNVALSNTDGNATIAGTCCGTLNNISVDMVMENSTDVRVGALVLGTLGANISNVFVHITGMGGYRLRYGYVSLYDHARIEGETTVSTTVKNVYVARTSGTTQTVGQYLVGTSETGAYNPYDDEAGTFASVKVYDKEKPATTDANYGAFANGVDYQTYAQLATDLAAGNVIVFDDTAYWDLTGGYPTFKTKTVS